MSSLTTWARLEPRTRSESMPAVAARVADPLWMVARQWQSGELDGSDTASPVYVRLRWDTSPISRWTTGAAGGSGVGSAYPAGTPVEALVDAVPAVVGLRDRALGGRQFLRLLGPELSARYGAGFRRAFALEALSALDRDNSDEIGLRWSAVLTGRAIDGAALRAALGPAVAPTLPAEPILEPGHEGAVMAAAAAFARWWDRQFPSSRGAWTPRRLAAPFRLGVSTAAGPMTLTAAEHRGGRVDWHTFDISAGGPLATGDPASVPATFAGLPTQMTYPGMPAARWWQFENTAVDLGRIEAGPDDLGRLLLAQFALVYGNDFFVVPLSAPVGSVCRILSLEVDTCFGDTLTVPSAASYDSLTRARRWRMFHCDDGAPDGGGGQGVLVLAPSAVDLMQGPEAEDVLIARDEMANLAWAIERRVRGPLGPHVERREVEHARQRRSGQETSTESTLHYRLSTTVPDSWLALVPALDGTLELGSLTPPRGQLLADTPRFRLDAVELTRTGRRVTAHARRARSVDGSVLVWWAWQVRPGRGESSSGLRHDDFTHQQSP
jgi:hypothetical protein